MDNITNKSRNIYTVSGLNKEIKSVIEDRYPMIWITGEISNLTRASSGHIYFTLKDKTSQISCVMFRGQSFHLKFNLEKGLNLIGFGRLSLYEPRGSYQIIFEHLEPEGSGALHLAFEQLKKKLMTEGLFDDEPKKQIPYMAKKISIITSPKGSVIHDIINITTRRFPGLHIEIAPVAVQGSEAEKQIVAAIQMLNARQSTEVIILARGGGSIEDLMAFNTESVARAIYNSDIPVISAVGHETDYTIADFVADLRAPTPSAAAELIAPDKAELSLKIKGLEVLLRDLMKRRLKNNNTRLANLARRLRHPGKKIQDLMLRNDDLNQRLIRAMRQRVTVKTELLVWKNEKLRMLSPKNRVTAMAEHLETKRQFIISRMHEHITQKKSSLNESTQRLNDLNPMRILERGYSIARTKGPEKKVITRTDTVKENQDIEILIANGTLDCEVQRITKNVKKQF